MSGNKREKIILQRNEKRSFRPLVATSLALALGAGVVVAEPKTINTTQTINESTNADILIENGSQHSITVTVQGAGTTLTGNIGGKHRSIGHTKETKVNFIDGSKHKGDIITGPINKKDQVNNGNDFSKKVVVYDGGSNSDVVMEGSIVSHGLGEPTFGNVKVYERQKKNNGNHVTFKKGSMQGNINVSSVAIYTAPGEGAYRHGYNKVDFTDKEGTQKLVGSVISNGVAWDKGRKHQTNDVTFTYGGEITGNVETTAGTNNITFGTKGSSDNKAGAIGGEVKAQKNGGSGGSDKFVNNINFYGEGRTGRVTAQGGRNNIVFHKDGKTESSVIAGNASATQGGINSFDFGGTLLFEGDIQTGNGNSRTHVTMHTDGATLALKGKGNTLSTLTGTKDSKVDLARVGDDGFTLLDDRASGTYKTLTIGTTITNNNKTQGFKGEAEFEVYVGADSKADKVIFNSATKNGKDNTTKASAIITASGDKDTILNADGETILVATVKKDAKGNMEELKGGTKRIGALDVTTNLTKITENSNGNGEDKYYLGKGSFKINKDYQDITSTALIVNYDLYIANFNSLNKRMGELRDNPYGQGVWARVFGGAMSSELGSGSKTSYLTTQAGYDYSFGLDGARDYLGIALAYGKSWTKGNNRALSGGGTASLDSADSTLAEVGIYNSYVSDSGWYNDTILKFDYIISDFSLNDNTSLKTKTSNYAIVLSNEVGYRYKFGSAQDWYIDPQLEVAFGYFNQSNFNRVIHGENFKGVQDTILTLRNRVGGALGKNFTTEKNIVGVYVGAFYEYDYIVGGEANTSTLGTKTILQNKLTSNGRAIINVGSNISLGESTRLYVDVEKSFGDKQRTFMQFNAGVRYSFGEGNGYTPQATARREALPLKIDENKAQEEQSDTIEE